jgi:hypothetical protein
MPLGFDLSHDEADDGTPSGFAAWPALRFNGGERLDIGRPSGPRRARDWARGVLVVAVVVAVAVGVALLGNRHSPRAAAVADGPSVTVCGTLLAPAGTDGLHTLPGVTGGSPGAATATGTVRLRWGVSDEYLLRVADGCAHGASVRLTPARDVRIVRTVRAADGLPVAIALEPVYAGVSELVVSRPGQPNLGVTFDVVTLPGS